MRQHSDELSLLSRQLAEVKASQSKMSEETRAMKSQVLLLEAPLLMNENIL